MANLPFMVSGAGPLNANTSPNFVLTFFCDRGGGGGGVVLVVAAEMGEEGGGGVLVAVEVSFGSDSDSAMQFTRCRRLYKRLEGTVNLVARNDLPAAPSLIMLCEAGPVWRTAVECIVIIVINETAAINASSVLNILPTSKYSRGNWRTRICEKINFELKMQADSEIEVWSPIELL
eukprot:Gb_06117 [translate_table: standard]